MFGYDKVNCKSCVHDTGGDNLYCGHTVAGTELDACTKQAFPHHDDSIKQVKGFCPMAHTC